MTAFVLSWQGKMLKVKLPCETENISHVGVVQGNLYNGLCVCVPCTLWDLFILNISVMMC